MENRSFKKIDGRLWFYGTNERTDFKIKLSRLARNNKLAPAGSLWLEVESISKNQKAGIFVLIGAKEQDYLNIAAIIIRNLLKLEKAVEEHNKKKFFRRLIQFFKTIFKRKS